MSSTALCCQANHMLCTKILPAVEPLKKPIISQRDSGSVNNIKIGHHNNLEQQEYA